MVQVQLACQASDALHHLPAAAANRARGPGSETLRVTPPGSPRDVASHPIEPKDMERTHSGASSYMSELEEEREGPKPAPKPKGAPRIRAVILDPDCLLAVTSTAIDQLSGIRGCHNSASLSLDAYLPGLLQALVPGVRHNLLHLHAVTPYLCAMFGALIATFVLGMQSTTTPACIRCPLPAADLLAH